MFMAAVKDYQIKGITGKKTLDDRLTSEILESIPSKRLNSLIFVQIFTFPPCLSQLHSLSKSLSVTHTNNALFN